VGEEISLNPFLIFLVSGYFFLCQLYIFMVGEQIPLNPFLIFLVGE